MSYAMTSAEIMAATQAMDGATPNSFMHFILFFGAAMAIIWATFMLLGSIKKIVARKADVTEVISDACLVIFILIIAGVSTHYT